MFPQWALWKCVPHGIIIASLLAVSWGQYEDGGLNCKGLRAGFSIGSHERGQHLVSKSGSKEEKAQRFPAATPRGWREPAREGPGGGNMFSMCKEQDQVHYPAWNSDAKDKIRGGLDATRDIGEGTSISNRGADLDPSTVQTHKYVDENAHGSWSTLQIVAAAL
ncbi:hypothetical protein ACRRTK_022115 [Alexandromys fortis]